jgi:uridine phosphorylase
LGSLQADIPVESCVVKIWIGIDNMLRSYLIDEVSNGRCFCKTYQLYTKGKPYVIVLKNWKNKSDKCTKE